MCQPKRLYMLYYTVVKTKTTNYLQFQDFKLFFSYSNTKENSKVDFTDT